MSWSPCSAKANMRERANGLTDIDSDSVYSASRGKISDFELFAGQKGLDFLLLRRTPN